MVVRGVFVEEKAGVLWAEAEETPTMTYSKPIAAGTNFLMQHWRLTPRN